MISDDERREIAARLRAIDVSDLCDSNGLIIDSPVEGDLLLMRVIYETCDYRDGLHYFPSHFKAKAVVELLADLIDRPITTRHGKIRTKYGRNTPCCEVCGYSIGDMRWNYCPKCGAVITND